MKKILLISLLLIGCQSSPLKKSAQVIGLHSPNGALIAQIDAASGYTELYSGAKQEDVTLSLLREVARLNQALAPKTEVAKVIPKKDKKEEPKK